MRELETKRLVLRKLRADDAESIFRNWASDSEVTKYVTWNVHKDINETKAILDMWLAEYDNDNCYRYGIVNKADGELIGIIDVVGYHHGNPVIGYSSCRGYWGNGFMTEALGAVMKELEHDGFTELVIEAAENIASNRVIEKNGFKLVGKRQDRISEMKPQVVTINSYRYYVEKQIQWGCDEMQKFHHSLSAYQNFVEIAVQHIVKKSKQ